MKVTASSHEKRPLRQDVAVVHIGKAQYHTSIQGTGERRVWDDREELWRMIELAIPVVSCIVMHRIADNDSISIDFEKLA
jgi:hypothetical protein